MITLKEVQHHEAGHAVVAEALKGARSVRWASVIPAAEDGSAGRVVYEDEVPSDVATWESYLVEEIVSRAGSVAGARVAGRKSPEPDPHDSVAKYALAARLGAPASFKELTWRSATLAEAAVTAFWPLIEEVAAALAGARELSGDEVRRIVATRQHTRKITVHELDLMVGRKWPAFEMQLAVLLFGMSPEAAERALDTALRVRGCEERARPQAPRARKPTDAKKATRRPSQPTGPYARAALALGPARSTSICQANGYDDRPARSTSTAEHYARA